MGDIIGVYLGDLIGDSFREEGQAQIQSIKGLALSFRLFISYSLHLPFSSILF